MDWTDRGGIELRPNGMGECHVWGFSLESEAELAAGLTVDGDQIVRALYAAADRLEAAQTADRGRKIARRR